MVVREVVLSHSPAIHSRPDAKNTTESGVFFPDRRQKTPLTALLFSLRNEKEPSDALRRNRLSMYSRDIEIWSYAFGRLKIYPVDLRFAALSCNSPAYLPINIHITISKERGYSRDICLTYHYLKRQHPLQPTVIFLPYSPRGLNPLRNFVPLQKVSALTRNSRVIRLGRLRRRQSWKKVYAAMV